MSYIQGRFVQVKIIDDPQLSLPLIDVSIIPYNQRSTTGGQILRSSIPALIDTGATNTTVDSTLANDCGLTNGRGADRMVTDRIAHFDSYLTTLYIEDIGLGWSADLAAADFDKPIFPWRIILGLDFLHMFNITITRNPDLIRLDYVAK